MKNLFISAVAGLICTSFTALPRAAESAGRLPATNDASVFTPVSAVALLYNEMNLDKSGLPEPAFEMAYNGYQKLVDRDKLPQARYLTICDFSQSSSHRRFYLIDMEQRRLLLNTYVAHGRNSGAEYATRFSNKVDSWQSSLGFYVTGQTYQGSNGLSLRLQGLEPGINDKALQRTIVIHGAAYVDPARARAGVMMGRSFGCPAVPKNESARIINTIKNGSCLFIYHPGEQYQQQSTILND